MLDLHPASEDCFRIWSHLTCDEGATQVHTFDEDINSRSLLLASTKTNMKQATRRKTGNYGVKKALKVAEKKRYKRKPKR